MESSEHLAPKMSNVNNGRMQLVLVVIALVVAVVALIVAFVGLSMKGTTNIMASPDGNTRSPAGLSSSSGTSDDKIWAIALGHGNGNEAYIDEGTLKGFLVDLSNAVCKTANKNCRIVFDLWIRCWDSEAGQVARGAIGLMGDWYDACAGWYGTYDRYRTYAFSDPFGKADPASLYVKPGSPLKSSWRDFAGKKVGILDGWVTDEFCLTRNADQFTSGTPFNDNNVIHYADIPDLVEAVMNGEVDYAFGTLTTFVPLQLERVTGDPVLPCAVHGSAMMARKVNQEFLNWWNEAQKRLMATTEYKTICKDLEEEHGHQPGQTATDICFI